MPPFWYFKWTRPSSLLVSRPNPTGELAPLLNHSLQPRSRTHYLDNLRTYLTALVILHHTAVAYGGAGGWYYLEYPNQSSLPLAIFNALNQTYFMAAFFVLSGYFSAHSIQKPSLSGCNSEFFSIQPRENANPEDAIQPLPGLSSSTN